MLQFPLKLQKAAYGEFALQVFTKEVGCESRAAAGCLQGVSCGGAVTMAHAHAGLGTNDALDLVKLLQIHLSITIQIKHLESDLEVPLGSGQHSGEEDVVRKRDKATFPQCVKNAVLICKLLPLLGDLLRRGGGHAEPTWSYLRL